MQAFVLGGVLAGAAALGYVIRAYESVVINKFRGVAKSGSAFAKAAEADAKIKELKVIAETKKAEATAVHDSLDEVHKILG